MTQDEDAPVLVITPDMLVTDHFRLSEFACHDGTPYPAKDVDDEDPAHGLWLETRLVPLCRTLEVVRTGCGGRAMTIESGFRSMTYDERLHALDPGDVAPASGSQHPKGRAADVSHSVLSPADLHKQILLLYSTGMLPFLGGLGLYPTFVHLDVRPRPADGHLARWQSSRLSSRV
jgi:hypothetical protein